jgi:bud emergence protein 1
MHYVSGGPSTAATTSSFSAALPSSSFPTSASASGAGAGQPPYIKIKIYDRATDDLIAIRVHPAVSHDELFEKVRARLGPEVQVLRYRTGMGAGAGGAYRELKDDRELREWIKTEDQKLVLYAEQ